jgi:O-antigen biosynthesis protein WbqV
MGQPVKIADLARKMIQLSGKDPDRDIAIEVIGARPGEKLHEELWTESDLVTPSEHPAILQLARSPIDSVWLDAELRELERLVESGETLELVGRLAAIVRDPKRLDVETAAAAIAEQPVNP